MVRVIQSNVGRASLLRRTLPWLGMHANVCTARCRLARLRTSDSLAARDGGVCETNRIVVVKALYLEDPGHAC